MASDSAGSQVDIQNSHGEVEGQLAIFLIAEDHAQELIAQVNFSRLILLRAGLDDDRLIERALEIRFEFLDIFRLHARLRIFVFGMLLLARLGKMCKPRSVSAAQLPQ